jgi:hypothetical protein
MFKLVKFLVMFAMVVWIAAAVSAMVSGAMGMMKHNKMPWMKMKEQLREKMPMMREKMCEKMEEAEENVT